MNGLGPYINTIARSIVPNLPTLLAQQGKTESVKVVSTAINGMGKAILISALNKLWKEMYPGVGVRRGKRSGIGLTPAEAALVVWTSRRDLRTLLNNDINVWYDIVSVIAGSEVKPSSSPSTRPPPPSPAPSPAAPPVTP